MTKSEPTPSPDTEATREDADIETSSDRYAQRFAGPTGQWFLEMQRDVALHLLGEPLPESILDVGGGHGQLAHPLCERGCAVTVLGSDPRCRGRIASLVEQGRCRFVVGDVIRLPFADRSFDTAISFRLLTHCRQWPVLVKELCRTARRRVLVDYPTAEGLNRFAPALFGAKSKLELNTRRWRLFRHGEVTRAFESCGFGLQRRQGQFFLPMVFHRVLRCRPLSVALERGCRALGLTRRWGSPVIALMARTAGD
jgi:SAM-dependent methyltransferase